MIGSSSAAGSIRLSFAAALLEKRHPRNSADSAPVSWPSELRSALLQFERRPAQQPASDRHRPWRGCSEGSYLPSCVRGGAWSPALGR